MSKCKQLETCNVEIFVYAETAWQKQNGKLWARQIWKQIVEGGVVYQLELSNLIIAVENVEPMYISPDTAVVETCPGPPLVRNSPRNPSLLQALHELLYAIP